MILSDKEQKILEMVADGYTNLEIACRIGHTERYMCSSNGPMARIYRRLGIHPNEYPTSVCRTVAVSRGFRRGLLQ